MGGEVSGRETGKGKETKERKDKDERERKGKKIVSGFSILVRVKNPILYPSQKNEI